MIIGDTIKAFGTTADEMGRRVARRLTMWARSQHGPWDVHGDGSEAVCRQCMKPWPCDEFIKLDRRIEEDQ
jgi:hypothetical protein